MVRCTRRALPLTDVFLLVYSCEPGSLFITQCGFTLKNNQPLLKTQNKHFFDDIFCLRYANDVFGAGTAICSLQEGARCMERMLFMMKSQEHAFHASVGHFTIFQILNFYFTQNKNYTSNTFFKKADSASVIFPQRQRVLISASISSCRQSMGNSISPKRAFFIKRISLFKQGGNF